MNTRTAVTAEGVTVRLNKTNILRGVDFRANAGELTAIVGPNGSGKSTLLKALTGDVGFNGRIRFNDYDLSDLSGTELANKRAVLAQSTPVAFPFSVYEIVRLGLLDRLANNESELIANALERVGLRHLEGRTYQVLSGGEKQRTQFARILLQAQSGASHGQPKWLFLDEPVASLDIKHQLEVMSIALDFARSGGGVICVMHDLNLTSMFADSVAVLQDGKCIAQGPPENVFNNDCLGNAYDCALRVNEIPRSFKPFVLPHRCLSSDRAPKASALAGMTESADPNQN